MHFRGGATSAGGGGGGGSLRRWRAAGLRAWLIRLAVAISTCAAMLLTAPAALAATGGISGTVTNASDSQPVANVQVDVFDSVGDTAAVECTAVDGTYSAPGLTPGNYTVEFDPSDTLCGPSLNYVTQFYNGQAAAGSATVVPVSGGATTSNVSAALQPGAVISGTVTDTSTDALAGVEVDLYGSSQAFVAETCTAANGSYSISALPGGTYYVEFETSGTNNCSARGFVTQYYSDTSDPSSATAIIVMPGTPEPGINAAMRSSGTITGTVTDAVTHAGLANIGVNVLQGGSVIEEVCTGSGGTYTAGGLEQGSYTVSFQPVSGCGSVSGYNDQTYSGSVPVTPGGTTAHIDEALAPQSSTIAGTVTSTATGQGLSGVVVTANNGTGGFSQTCTTANGTYSIAALPAGSYTVYFDPLSNDCGPAQNYVPQFYNDESEQAAANAVAVNGSATVSGVDAALRPAGAIAGSVTDAVTGRPVDDVPVLVYTPDGTAVTGTCTASDGSYTIAGLAPGTYTVSFAGQSTGCGTPLGYALQSTTNVQVSAGATTGQIDAQLLSQSQGEITGTVTDAASGAALAGVVVTIYDASGAPLGSGTATDSQGRYAVAGLAPGNYRVGFADPSGRYAAQFYAGATTLAAATPIVISGGKLTGSINAALSPPPTSSIPGRLTLASGRSLSVSVKGVVTIKLSCSGSGACRGSASLVTTVVTHLRHKKVIKKLVIAKAAISISTAGTVDLRITLDRSGRAQLTQHHGHLAAELLLAGTASGTAFQLTDSVRLIAKR